MYNIVVFNMSDQTKLLTTCSEFNTPTTCVVTNVIFSATPPLRHGGGRWRAVAVVSVSVGIWIATKLFNNITIV